MRTPGAAARRTVMDPHPTPVPMAQVPRTPTVRALPTPTTTEGAPPTTITAARRTPTPTEGPRRVRLATARRPPRPTAQRLMPPPTIHRLLRVPPADHGELLRRRLLQLQQRLVHCRCSHGRRCRWHGGRCGDHI